MNIFDVNNLSPAVKSGTDVTLNFVFNRDLQVVYVADKEVTRFAGIAKTESFFRPMAESVELDLLIKGFNNRTRERNYFKLYCQLLNGEISEEEFDLEIEDKENLYVVEAPKVANPSEVCTAVCLSDRLLGIETTEDFSSTFGIDDASIGKYLKAIGHE